MNKTPVKGVVLSRLTALNDQLCFFLLLEEELIRRLDDFGPGVQSAFTSDVFARNPYAPKIHVRISQLESFQTSNRAFTFGAYFSTSYEVASEFFDLAESLLIRVSNVEVLKSRKEGPEDRYNRVVANAGLLQPPVEIISTLAYCRYRRNSFIHLGSVPVPRYLKLSSTRGPLLNSYWGATRLPVDFTEARISPLGDEETIALLKVLRISVERLDMHLAGILDRHAVLVDLTLQRFGKEAVRMNTEVARRRVRMIASLLKLQFGGSAPGAEVDSIVRGIGVR
jgi:hypothetical protein